VAEDFNAIPECLPMAINHGYSTDHHQSPPTFFMFDCYSPTYSFEDSTFTASLIFCEQKNTTGVFIMSLQQLVCRLLEEHMYIKI
jgi:hypothetical protein